MLEDVIKDFYDAGNEYRAKPFWAWNGKMQPEELRRQIHIMKQMGFGGFFMHSRIGLDTEYLGEEWFKCITACVEEAKKLGMQAWLYDEDRWPSGSAGGLITKNPEYRHKYLAVEILDKSTEVKNEKDLIAVFTARLDGDKARNVNRHKFGKITPSAGESILIFRQKDSECSSWYNGYTYLDVLSEDAVNAFIGSTHEKYRQRYGKDFGKIIPGIFMDEPNHGCYFTKIQSICDKNGVPWTPRLPEVFKTRYGYDILDRIVEVFFDVTDVDENGITSARHDYHDCTTYLFCTAFGKQLYKWCDKNGLDLTGHLLLEDTLYHQSQAVGSCMRFYEYMQAPGMDLLTQHWSIFDTARQVTSVARQLGRKRRLTETYGCTGWDFDFAGHKALGDWQVALGINLRCQHLSWYTMLGEAKRDYPASIFYQSPWWKQYKTIEDYFARVNTVMSHGKECRDVLMIHPVESAWMLIKHGWELGNGRYCDDSVQFNAAFSRLTSLLDAANVEFDFGDEEIMSRLAKVVDDRFHIAQASYKAVIVPPMITIRSSTLELLKKFHDAGGEVIFAADAPRYVDALKSDIAVEFAKICTTLGDSRYDMERLLGKYRLVSICDEKGKEIPTVLHLLRENQDAFYLFVCNTSADYVPDKKGVCDMTRKKAVDRKRAYNNVFIKGFAGCIGQPIELNPIDCDIKLTKANKTDCQWEIETSLPALASRLFVIPKKRKSTLAAKTNKSFKQISSITLGNERWDYMLSEDNVLVLDMPKFRIGDSKWSKKLEILQIDRKVRDAINIQHRGETMIQPWARSKETNPKTIRVQLKYEFSVKDVPSGNLSFGIEAPALHRVFVNDIELDQICENGWWVDFSLRRLPVNPSLLHVGVNTIYLETNYNENHPGLEMVYLLGNFGVSVKGCDVTMVKLPEKLKLGSWTNQGLAFYSGNVGYRTNVNKPPLGKRAFIKIGAYKGIAVEIIVNGYLAGVIGWGCGDEVEITKLLNKARNEVIVKILGHRRNSHGPLHLNKEGIWIGPDAFLPKREMWSDVYVLKNIGMFDAPVLKICE